MLVIFTPAWGNRTTSGSLEIDLTVSVSGLLVGLVVGLTGMSGGALLRPIMVLFFGVAPLTAVSSNLVAGLVMKPVGGGVHLRRGTVNLGIVRWLVLGSVPAAFVGVLVLAALGDGEATQNALKVMLGIALLIAPAALGHLLFGDFQLALTTSLLIGALPGVYVGARWSALRRTP